ncbi:hypothetical protein K504DRAFT_461294 [Pleomassaria siparia CBS 279.74]|uniref:Uncharacterized protein n=1 Tax=Pleomassaria siparia CBS 279.74 TaxID=1314801 RepID=A0A6G1JVA0_9PLEO|nr:hypothetical protein K504DRAFT_461294 [Pleomassaria siparia CBS 279.74]
MADALCGPSNALQTFQKHTSVDRTLQQDRLSSRQSPAQGFRSSLGPNVGALDAEFDAFQAGHAGPPQPLFQPFPPQQHLTHHAPRPHFAQTPVSPDWASDFQRLNIGPAHMMQHHPPQASDAAAAWHQDFMNQSPGIQSQQHIASKFGGMDGAGTSMGAYARPMYGGFGGVNSMGVQGQGIVNGNQSAAESVPTFDDAAFERAFQQAQQDMVGETELESRQQEAGNFRSEEEWETAIRKLEEENKKLFLQALAESQSSQESYEAQLEHLIRENKERLAQRSAQEHVPADYESLVMLHEEQDRMRRMKIQQQERQQQRLDTLAETDPVLLRIRDKRLPVYLTIKLRSEFELGRKEEALQHLQGLEDLEQRGLLAADASEAKWCVDTLQRIVNRDPLQEMRERVESLIAAINERLMSSYPLLATGIPIRQENIWDELRAAGYNTPDNPLLERVDQQPEQKQGKQAHRNNDDEMADTAGRLLERVADNTSEKFQNSQFLELMRRLRDREVRVEGDKMVEVSAQPSVSIPPVQSSYPTTAFSSAPPEIDRNILDHAGVDFGMPVDSEQEPNFSRQSSVGPPTDESSGQFSYYNVNSSYHR